MLVDDVAKEIFQLDENLSVLPCIATTKYGRILIIREDKKQGFIKNELRWKEFKSGK